jgi:hypothetical protein
VSGAIALSLAGKNSEAGSAEFPHVLRGVVLTGQAAALADRLDPEFLAEVGWDPATRVWSPPAGHRLVGRPLCRAPGCSTTANGCVLSAAGG